MSAPKSRIAKARTCLSAGLIAISFVSGVGILAVHLGALRAEASVISFELPSGRVVSILTFSSGTLVFQTTGPWQHARSLSGFASWHGQEARLAPPWVLLRESIDEKDKDEFSYRWWNVQLEHRRFFLDVPATETEWQAGGAALSSSSNPVWVWRCFFPTWIVIATFAVGPTAFLIRVAVICHQRSRRNAADICDCGYDCRASLSSPWHK